MSVITVLLAVTAARASGTVTGVKAREATVPIATGPVMTAQHCMGCHEVPRALSHPVGVRPSMAMPAGFPLEGGQVTCTTCHLDGIDAHSRAGENPGLLRRAGSAAGAMGETGKAFCTQCHTGSEPTRRSQHPLATARAHLVWPAGSSSALRTENVMTDDGIRSCLSCHDGTFASDAFGNLLARTGTGAGSSAGAGGGGGMQPSGSDHPVGMEYPATSALRVGDRGLRARDRLDVRIRLTNNQVTCNSCHSLYAGGEGEGGGNLLVMSNRESALCTACHTMQ